MVKRDTFNFKVLNLIVAYLVISLSFVPYMVTADIFSSQASGVDNAPGFIRSTDTIKINSTSILPTSILFPGNSTYVSMACSGIAPLLCTYTKQVTGIVGTYQLMIREQNGASIPITLQTDTSAPLITSIAFKGLGWGVSAQYSINENGNNGQNSCSGVKTVELYLNNKLSGTTTHSINNCQISGTVNGTIPNMKGSVTSAIVVKDYLGNNASAVGGTFNIESILPKIATTVNVYKAGTENKITTVPPNSTVAVDIEVKITEEDLSNEVYAYMSDLNIPNFVNADCSLIENSTYSCKFLNVAAKVSKSNPKIVVYAKDNAGNLANQTIALPLNSVTPTMTVSVVAEKNGQRVTMIGGPNATKSYVANLVFSVKYNSVLDLDHLLVDLSELTPSTSPSTVLGNNSNLTSSIIVNTGNGTKAVYPSSVCEKIDNTTYNCTVSGVGLRAQKTSPKITIYAIDESGGMTSQVVTPTITIVSSAGTLSSISPPPERCVSGTCYMKATGNLVIATISSNSLFNQSDIKINGVKATCSKGSNGLSCNASVSGSTSLELSGFDDFGNPLSGKSTAKIVIDSIAPKFLSEFNQTPECPTSGETLVIKTNATDSGGSPSLSISAITTTISNNNLTKQVCSKQGTTSNHICSLSVSGIISEPTNSALDVIVEDLAGNQVKKTVPVSVCIKSSDTPDFIKSITTRGSVPKIDQKIASKIILKLPVGLNVNLADDQTKIIQRSKVTCSATPGVTDSYLINENNNQPVLMLALKYSSKWTADDNDSLEVVCKQDFKIRHENVIYTTAESEEIKVKLQLFNQPLGTLNQTYTKKVKDIKTQLKDLDKKIAKYDKVQKYLGGLCKTAETLGRINSILQTAKTTIWGVMVTLNSIGINMDGPWQAVQEMFDGYMGFVSKTVWPQGWFPTGGNTVGLTVKYTCTIYSCKLYDFNTWTSIGMSYAADKYLDAQRKVELTAEYDKLDSAYKDLDAKLPPADDPIWDDPIFKNSDFIGLDGVPMTRDQIIYLVASQGTGSEFVDLVYRQSPDSTPKGYYQGVQPNSAKQTYDDLIEQGYDSTSAKSISGYDEKNTGSNQINSISSNANSKQMYDDLLNQGYDSDSAKSISGYKDDKSVASTKPSTVSINKVATETIIVNQEELKLPIPAPPVESSAKSSSVKTTTSAKDAKRYGVFKRILIKLKILKTTPFPKGMSTDGTGNAVSVPSAQLTTSEQSIENANVRINNAVDAFMGSDGSYIFNPYKSKHYDGLCIPAKIFNAEKEKQLLCKKLGCIQEMAKTGGPIESCEFEYELGYCMYVDGARYKLEGGASFTTIISGVKQAFLSNMLGTGVTAAYLFAPPHHCVDYQIPGGELSKWGPLFSKQAAASLVCGVGGTLIGAREMISVAKNGFNPLSDNSVPTKISPEGAEFCSGVNYND